MARKTAAGAQPAAKKPARRTKAAPKRTEKRATANPERRYELAGLAIVVVGIISACGLAGLNVGFVGVYFARFLHYMFGVGAAVVVLAIFVVGWYVITRHRVPPYTLRDFGITAFCALALAAYHHAVVAPGAEILPESLAGGGGLIGGGILFLIRKCFGVTGGIIVVGAGLVGSVLLATKWSLGKSLQKTEDVAKKSAKAAGQAASVAATATYEKTVEVGERVGEDIARKMREKRHAHSFYDQDADTRFAVDTAVGAQGGTTLAQIDEPTAVATEEGIPARKMPGEQDTADASMEFVPATEAPSDAIPEQRFTIDYGARSAEPDTAAQDGEELEAREGLEALAAAGVAGAAEAAASVGVAKAAGTSLAAGMVTVSANGANHLAQATVIGADGTAHLATAPKYSSLSQPDSMGAHFGNEDAPEHPPAPPVAPPPPPYVLPSVTEILTKNVKKQNVALEVEIQENAQTLAKTLHDFRVDAKIINACHGPAVTRYELEPAPGVKVSKITGLADDLALSLAASAVRIEPIPGKAAIGIEVPNKELEGVRLREVLENPQFEKAKSKLTCGLGMDIGGQPIFADLGKMPHLLVAGATGSGKSVCINTLITSILFKAKPDEVKFILIDPKMVELSNYNGIPHLMVPVVTEAKKAASVLNWAVQEMEKRYARFAEHNVRNMATYNDHFPETKMPAIVIIIDELADLMMVAPHDVEDAICRLAQKARAAGIHMVLATQRPSVDVITGIIKANIPSRISFAVSSQIDSRTILDASGAEKLLGKGDMLFYPVGAAKPRRVQGAFISDEEVEKLLDFIRAQGQAAEPDEEIVAFTENAMREEEESSSKGAKKAKPKVDALLEDAIDCVLSTGIASTSGVQRRFSIGYQRAARLIDTMAELGIVGPANGSKPREILMNGDQARAAVESVKAEA
ncbi:FtsK/SpoIIIE family DNA translocase [Selenomonas sp.]|uniref:FtsK/SpoIIIE family DNA translocase n=1 Tax=Selenomonas sp. TaxID=2053611 RepID=UPI002A756C18|nr:DNA translocase FtsK 4TM domain-containing protein [Selenomonas sp.]MDY3296418.1 DNA translocase FtsK 4TM domain-containing protein [Selenomonas sp.]